MNSSTVKQLGKVLDFIEQNPDENITIEKVAAIGNYSPYHFHRLFKAYTGETILEFSNRKRLEKIAALLIRDKKLTISELVFRYGFSDNAALTKAFKKRYGISPSAFRKLSSSQYDKVKQSKNGQTFEGLESYICRIETLKNKMMNTKITIQPIEPLHIVAVNHIGVDNLDAAFTTIINWSVENEGIDPQKMEVIRIYHDSFKITAPEKVRMEIGVRINREVKPEAGIFYRLLEPGECITGDFEMDPQDFEKAWSYLYIMMNENGYTPTEALPFEIIRNNYKEHPEKKIIVTLYIPVKRKQ
ncbi:AraC family transcriptional regulator [Flavobacterium cerinum]|uniref:AraC family transcriptional regulator n=1 Tax=Flavobacterium cerinum TaxID=2502784 RepID=A0ABY5IMT1_9FLAO|nr:helix-turn-helix domain-containing protein [Flavobacterium cerinum]UUC44064.1 AraC family transcriptional regulator [Flavobacterium cerinum]